MIISTKIGSSFSIFLVLYNYVVFRLCKMTILTDVNSFVSKEFILAIVIIILATFLYILIDVKVSGYREIDVIEDYGYYDETLKCYIFYDYDADYLFDLKEDCKVYINSSAAIPILFAAEDGMCSHMEELGTRMLTLNKSDKFFIYSYKYLSIIVFSISCCIFWQLSSYMVFGDTILNILFTVLILFLKWVVIMVGYFVVYDLLLRPIEMFMKKRNLRFFIYK